MASTFPINAFSILNSCILTLSLLNLQLFLFFFFFFFFFLFIISHLTVTVVTLLQPFLFYLFIIFYYFISSPHYSYLPFNALIFYHPFFPHKFAISPSTASSPIHSICFSHNKKVFPTTKKVITSFFGFSLSCWSIFFLIISLSTPSSPMHFLFPHVFWEVFLFATDLIYH